MVLLVLGGLSIAFGDFGDWTSPIAGAAAILAGLVCGFGALRNWRFVLPPSVAILAVAALSIVIHLENARRGDYAAGAHGNVVDGAGQPIPGALVQIRFRHQVFEALEPLQEASTFTDPLGQFALSYLSCGEPGGAYSLGVTKVGYRPSSFSGSGYGHHRVVLQPALGDAK
jgi:hypothetical protein